MWEGGGFKLLEPVGMGGERGILGRIFSWALQNATQGSFKSCLNNICLHLFCMSWLLLMFLFSLH